MTNIKELTIANFKDGAIIERLEKALCDVLENIADPHTDNGPREIILKAKFKPDEFRAEVEILVNCTTKLKDATITDFASIDRDHLGRAVAYEILRQAPLPIQTETELPYASSAAMND